MMTSEYWAYNAEIAKEITRGNMDQVEQINDKMN